MANSASTNILSTSTNLFGFCLIVVTPFNLTNKAEIFLFDDASSVLSILLVFSSLFSFFSIQSKNKISEFILEKIADYPLILSLIVVLRLFIPISINFYG